MEKEIVCAVRWPTNGIIFFVDKSNKNNKTCSKKVVTVKFSLWPVGGDTCCINNNNFLFMVRFILKTLLNNHSVTPSTVPAVKSWQNPLPESLGSITTCRRLPPVSGGETAAVILLSHQYWCHLSRQPNTLCFQKLLFLHSSVVDTTMSQMIQIWFFLLLHVEIILISSCSQRSTLSSYSLSIYWPCHLRCVVCGQMN